jgi:hypothetical protein
VAREDAVQDAGARNVAVVLGPVGQAPEVDNGREARQVACGQRLRL